MKNKIILLSTLGVLAFLLGSSAKAGIKYTSNEKSSKTPDSVRAMWMGCRATNIDVKTICVETLCIKKAKDATGKLICAKEVCQHIRKTKDTTCVKWRKPIEKLLNKKKPVK